MTSLGDIQGRLRIVTVRATSPSVTEGEPVSGRGRIGGFAREIVFGVDRISLERVLRPWRCGCVLVVSIEGIAMSARSIWICLSLGLGFATIVGLGRVWGDEPAAEETKKRGAAGKPHGDGMEDMGAALMAGLKKSPGCLGVESARTDSGQEAIFGWFENKKAVMTWYESPLHQSMAGQFFSQRDDKYEPMSRITDDTGPIMVIAALRFAESPQVKGVRMPISQISIELYQPLPAGLSINGAFTPERVPVPGRRDSKAGRPPKGAKANAAKGAGGPR